MWGIIFILSTFLGLVFSTGFFVPIENRTVEKDVVYRVFQDTSLTMDLYFPEQRGTQSPLIIYIHGGGWYSGDKATGIGLNNMPELVRRGYVVASINYRLAPRYMFPAQIEDVEYAVDFLRSNASTYRIDPAHIGVMGESAGGHLAALLGLSDERQWLDGARGGVSQSPRVQAVVDMFGPSDLKLTFEQHWSMLIEHVFNTSDPESELIKRASPVTYVSRQAPPFLILHGDKDNQVSLDQSRELYSRLKAESDPATLVVVKNADHEFVPEGGPISPSQKQIDLSIADFFDKYLK